MLLAHMWVEEEAMMKKMMGQSSGDLARPPGTLYPQTDQSGGHDDEDERAKPLKTL